MPADTRTSNTHPPLLLCETFCAASVALRGLNRTALSVISHYSMRFKLQRRTKEQYEFGKQQRLSLLCDEFPTRSSQNDISFSRVPLPDVLFDEGCPTDDSPTKQPARLENRPTQHLVTLLFGDSVARFSCISCSRERVNCSCYVSAHKKTKRSPACGTCLRCSRSVTPIHSTTNSASVIELVSSLELSHT